MEFNPVSSVYANNPNPAVTLDPDALASISQSTSEASSEIASIASKIQSLSDSTAGGVWDGQDADTFRAKAADLVKLFNQLNEELATDGVWAGNAGNAGADAVSENTSMMSNL